jgi:hypothetical protein
VGFVRVGGDGEYTYMGSIAGANEDCTKNASSVLFNTQKIPHILLSDVRECEVRVGSSLPKQKSV